MTDTDKPAVVLEGEIVPAHVDVRLGSLPIRNPAQLVQQATELADVLADIINKQHLFTVIRNRKYVMCEGWTTLGAMLGIIPVEEYCRPIENGFEAKVKLLRASDGGQVGGASAECTFKEHTWKDRDSYALRSMALTRATGKAFRLSFSWVMKLAGFEATPAEEMIGTQGSGSVEAAQEVAKGKIEAAGEKKVTVSFSPGLTMFLHGPGCIFIETVLKSSATKNVLGQYIVNRKDSADVLKALGEAGVTDITEVEYNDIQNPTLAPTQSPAASPKSTAGSPQSSTRKGGSASQDAPPAAEGEVSGILLDVMDASGSKGPFQKLIIKPANGGANVMAHLFSNHDMPEVDGGTTQLFTLMRKAKGKPVTVFLKPAKGNFPPTVTGATRVALYEWEFGPDGYLPVRQQERL